MNEADCSTMTRRERVNAITICRIVLIDYLTGGMSVKIIALYSEKKECLLIVSPFGMNN